MKCPANYKFLLIVFLLGLKPPKDAAVRIEVSPSHQIGSDTKALRISCVLGDSSGVEGRQYLWGKITRQLPADLSAGQQQTQEAIKEVKLYNVPEGKRMVDVKVLNPNTSDAGSYTCKLVYMDKSNVLRYEKASANVKWSGSSLESLVMSVAQKIGDIERVIRTAQSRKLRLAAIEARVKNHTAQLSSLAGKDRDTLQALHSIQAKRQRIGALLQEATAKNVTLSKLTLRVAQLMSDKEGQLRLRRRLAAAKAKVRQLEEVNAAQSIRPISVFSVTNKHQMSVNVGKPIHFFDVDLNEGLNYNTKKLEYIAPVDGLYEFHLVAGTYNLNDSRLEIELEVDQRAFGHLHVTDSHGRDQSSLSVLGHLQRGAKVHAVAKATSKANIISGRKTSRFAGYLICPL